jgi:hypothetical protein
MADIDTGKAQRLQVATRDKKGRLVHVPWVRASDYDTLAADRDRLSRELAEAKEVAKRLARDVNDCIDAQNELHETIYQYQQRLAESERLAAARNQLNGVLAMENERLRWALRRYGQHTDRCLSLENGLMGSECTCGFFAALAPASGGAT